MAPRKRSSKKSKPLTRKQRAAKAKRSAAARKGWDTRRANARAAKRSAAASRGWATRRAAEEARKLEAAYSRVEDDYPELEDMADEWEIGFHYGGGMGVGPSHAVDVNMRLAREDGKPFAALEAQRVLRSMLDNLNAGQSLNPIPRGYVLAAIDWQRPRWGSSWKSGDVEDLASFNGVMRYEAGDPSSWSLESGGLRLGGVRRDPFAM